MPHEEEKDEAEELLFHLILGKFENVVFLWDEKNATQQKTEICMRSKSKLTAATSGDI